MLYALVSQLYSLRCKALTLQFSMYYVLTSDSQTSNRTHYQMGIKMYSLQNVLDCPALINFKHGIFRPCPQSMAGTASLAAAPGGAAAAAAAPSAGSVPPPLGAPLPGGGPDGARPRNGGETEPAEANEPHTRHACAVDARPLPSSPTLVPHLCHILLSARMLPHAHAQITRT